MLTLTLTDTTHVDHPSIQLQCDAVRLTRGSIVTRGVDPTSIMPDPNTDALSASYGLAMATVRTIDHPSNHMSDGYILSFSAPDWAADIA